MQVEQVVGQGPHALSPGRARQGQWYSLAATTLAVAPASADAADAADAAAPDAGNAAAALPEPRVGHTASYLPRRKKVISIMRQASAACSPAAGSGAAGVAFARFCLQNCNFGRADLKQVCHGRGGDHTAHVWMRVWL